MKEVSVTTSHKGKEIKVLESTTSLKRPSPFPSSSMLGVFPFALICHWISIVFLLYGRRIATHSVDPSLTHFLGEFPGLGLALVPDVVVPEAEQRCSWSRKLDPNFCP